MGSRILGSELLYFLIWMKWLVRMATTVSVALTASAQAQLGPQTVVREFCRLDAMGARVTIHGWPQIAPLVHWQYEPAWDHVVLITSYTVGWPVAREDQSFHVEVRYAVEGTVTPSGFEDSPRIEARELTLTPTVDGNWEIAGPLLPPHIFRNHVDVGAMQQSLQRGGVNFLPNSLFVWDLYRRNGWEIPFEHTVALARTQIFRVTQKPEPGDLVLYLGEDTPYHVAVLESEDIVVSATLNGGIVRTPLDAFPGERRFLHLRPPELWPATPTPRASGEEIQGLLPRLLPTTTPRGSAAAAQRKPRRTNQKPGPRSKPALGKSEIRRETR